MKQKHTVRELVHPSVRPLLRPQRCSAAEMEVRTLKAARHVLKRAIKHLRGEKSWNEVPDYWKPAYLNARVTLLVRLSIVEAKLDGKEYIPSGDPSAAA